jgi:hypothetical protein
MARMDDLIPGWEAKIDSTDPEQPDNELLIHIRHRGIELDAQNLHREADLETRTTRLIHASHATLQRVPNPGFFSRISLNQKEGGTRTAGVPEI